MRALNLRQEEKNKLLEMCKALFPEYKIIYWETGNGDGWADGLLGFSVDSKSSTSIHWYEFCMTHIAPKVCKSDGITITFDGKYNPVEYLYEQFKKLKL